MATYLRKTMASGVFRTVPDFAQDKLDSMHDAKTTLPMPTVCNPVYYGLFNRHPPVWRTMDHGAVLTDAMHVDVGPEP